MTDITNAAVRPLEPLKPLAKLHRWLRIFFVIYIVSYSVFGIGSIWFAMSAPPDYDIAIDMLPADWLTALGGLFGVIALVVSVILFSVFTFRAMKNLHLIGTREVEMSPGWAVGWYFIPIANLFKPYQGMEQIFDGTQDVAGGNDADKRSRLPLWWGCWILGGILDRVALRVGGGITSDTDVSGLIASSWISAASCLLLVGAALAIMPILRIVTREQDKVVAGRSFD